MVNPTWFFTGLVYAAAVALARRGGVDIPRRVAVFFYALVLVYLYEPLTQDAVNLSVDFLRSLPPWAYLTDVKVAANHQLNDLALQIVPWAHQVRESWKALSPPLWNHQSACGYPLLASAQSSALSPLRLIGLPLSLAHAMTFEAAAKILIALTFMFLWCRRRGCSELASVFGAVAFGFSTFIGVWLHFPLITTACFVPAVFYLIDLLAERVTYPRFVAGAVVWTLMLFGGHPETVSHTFFFAVLYALWLVAVERVVPPRFFLTLGGALTISALLAAPLLAPFAETVTKSKRYADLQANPIQAEVPFSDWASAKLLLAPHFYGELPFVQSWGPAHAESISGFAGTLGIAAWFALLVHVVRRRAWRSREMFFVLATLFVVGIIMSWPGVREVFHLFFQLAANARLRLVLVLLLSMQTAMAIDLLPRDRRAFLIGVVATGALLLYTFLSSPYGGSYDREAARMALLPGAGVLLVAAIAAVMKKKQEWAVLLVLAGVTGELFEAARDWNPVVSAKEWMYPRTPLLQKLDELKAQVPAGEPFRIVANGPAFFPNAPAVYGYEDIRAHDPMVNARYIELLTIITNYDAPNYFADWTEFGKRFIDFLNVRYVVTTTGAEMPDRFHMLYEGPDGRIFENMTVLPRFYGIRNVVLEFNKKEFVRRLRELEGWSHTALLDKLHIEAEEQRGDFFDPRPEEAPIAEVKITEAGPSEYTMHVKAPRWSLVASSIPWWPGWKVERNGARIEPVRVNGGFIGFSVPPGELDVRVWYDPWTFRFGAIVALATIGILVGYWVYGVRGSSGFLAPTEPPKAAEDL